MVNEVVLIGNLGTDPEVKYFEGDKVMAKFTVATSSSFKNKAGEKKEETQWHNCVAWGMTAKIIEKYLKKGSQVRVRGMIKYDRYEKDGGVKYFTNIVIEKMTMLGKKGDNAGSSSAPASNAVKPQTNSPQVEEDDLPF